MAALDLQEQEQLAELKAWWEKRGNLVLTTLIIVFLAIAAYNGWRYYQRSQSLAASAVFEQVQSAAAAGDKAKTREIAGSLLENYPGSSYAPLGALMAAKTLFDAGEAQSAKAQLQWVIDKGRDEELKHVARVRLAGILLDEKSYDEGLKVLDAAHPSHFEALYADRRGDLLLAQGKLPEARTAWRDALKKSDAKTAMRGSLELKLELVGAAPAETAPK
jgi:predicted negative regulator of RcsB-dependent stress response